MNTDSILLFVTGGTFDKQYNELTGALAFKETHLVEMLRLGRCRLDVSIQTLMMIDSLDMSDADRALIVSACQQAAESRIVVTHGTDTMVETGMLLQKNLRELKAPIVLTGAMTPLGFEGSDGLQNLTESLLAARVLPAGVYVVMHNQVFPVDRVRKDRELARFVWK